MGVGVVVVKVSTWSNLGLIVRPECNLRSQEVSCLVGHFVASQMNIRVVEDSAPVSLPCLMEQAFIRH